MITLNLKNLELLPGRFYCGHVNFIPQTITKICGDNGVGKSTFFTYCENSKDEFFNGDVCFLDQAPLQSLHNYSLFDLETILEKYWTNFIIEDWKHQWRQMVRDFGFSPTETVQTLSGGQNQLIKLMMVSILRRSYYFWDEPFQALDPTKTSWWLDWIASQCTKGKTFVIIDHSTKLDRLCHSTYELCFVDLNHVQFNKVK